MSDNTLKIRIQIQQPPQQAIEQIYPDLPEPEIVYEETLDWKKISIAVLLLISILSLIGYFLFGTNAHETPSSNTAPSIGQTISPHKDSISVEEIAPVPETKDKTSEAKSSESLPVLSDSKALSSSNAPVQSAKTINPIEKKAIPVPISKPGPRMNQSIASPAKKPKQAEPSNIQKNSDHPQVIRAQLSHDIKAREPIDSIDLVQLPPGRSMPIYFYLQLKDMEGKKVNIFWYHNDKQDSQLPLEIRNNNWRTNASKHLDHQRLGAWRVELVDEAGNLLAKRSFTVTKQ